MGISFSAGFPTECRPWAKRSVQTHGWQSAGSVSHLAMRCGRFERPVGERDQLIIAEKIRRVLLHEAQYLDRKLANFDLGVAAAAQLDEVPQCPSVRGHEDLRLRRIGQNASC